MSTRTDTIPGGLKSAATGDEVGEGCAVTASFMIRHGEVADLEQCVALALLAAPERSASDWRKALAQDTAKPDHHLVVAESRGAIIGYGRSGLFEPEPEAPADTAPHGYYLTGVFVATSQRRRGIGAALTQARLDWISDRAAESWFFANAHNTPSIKLHQQFGFQEVTRQFSFPGLTFDGGEGILFRLRLDQQT